MSPAAAKGVDITVRLDFLSFSSSESVGSVPASMKFFHRFPMADIKKGLEKPKIRKNLARKMILYGAYRAYATMFNAFATWLNALRTRVAFICSDDH